MKMEQPVNLPAHDSKVVFIASLVVIVPFLLFAGILWRLDFFSFSGNEASAKIVASAITLVAALITSLITFVGLILKHTMDQKNLALRKQVESRERIEMERNANLKEEAENRLKVQAATQSIKLLSSPSGEDVPSTQVAGVILTLGDLGMLSLALSLVNQMLSDSEQSKFQRLDPGTAVWLIDKAIKSDVLEVQCEAARLTDYHVKKFQLPNGMAVFPAVLLSEAVISLPDPVRINATFAMIDLLVLRPFSKWRESVFSTIVKSLHYIWKNDPMEYIRTNAGVSLQIFLQVWEPDKILNIKLGAQKAADTLSELTQYEGHSLRGTLPTGHIKRSKALSEWIREQRSVSSNQERRMLRLPNA